MLVDRIRSALLTPLCDGSWTVIKENHESVGLPWRKDFEPGWGKPKYVERALAAVADDDVIAIAARVLDGFPRAGTLEVEQAVEWLEAEGIAQISEVTRLAFAAAMDGHRLAPGISPDDVLRRFSSSVSSRGFEYASGDAVMTEASDLEAWFKSTPGTAAVIPSNHLAVLDAYVFREWSDRRLFRLIEFIVHPTIRRGAAQAAFVQLLNPIIARDRFELVATDHMSGHPVFSVRPVRSGVAGRPKNLIFASTGPKPELGFVDAVNNDIAILANADHCLIYEEPLGDDGLRWMELVRWWAAREGLSSADASTRKSLGARLRTSLASEPERRFFAAYFSLFRNRLVDDLPALVPQVYLHYDPVSLHQLRARGDDRRFEVQRMDFLMLLPLGVRVVLEIDGQQHYATSMETTAKPSPKEYARTVRADRQLRLAGYDVYRFGGYELRDEIACAAVVDEFFTRLFRRHKLLPR